VFPDRECRRTLCAERRDHLALASTMDAGDSTAARFQISACVTSMKAQSRGWVQALTRAHDTRSPNTVVTQDVVDLVRELIQR